MYKVIKYESKRTQLKASYFKAKIQNRDKIGHCNTVETAQLR